MDAQPFLGIVTVSDEPLATRPSRLIRIGPRSEAANRVWGISLESAVGIRMRLCG